jgi:hypothetical protein
MLACFAFLNMCCNMSYEHENERKIVLLTGGGFWSRYFLFGFLIGICQFNDNSFSLYGR